MLGPHFIPSLEWFETDVSTQSFRGRIHSHVKKLTPTLVNLLMSSKYATFYFSNSLPFMEMKSWPQWPHRRVLCYQKGLARP